MTLPRVIPVVLGMLAVLATTAILSLTAVLGHALGDTDSAIRIAGILSSVLEALVLVLIGWPIGSSFGSRTGKSHWRVFSIWFGVGLFLCVVAAAAASVAALVRLSNASSALPSHILGTTATGFLVGSSVALGLSFALQLIFLVTHYISSRMGDNSNKGSQDGDTESRQSPQPHVKSIPYHETTPTASKRGSLSMSPPGSSAGRSATETMSSIRSSLSHVVRPITSKTRLLPRGQRSSTAASSFESVRWPDRGSVVEDGFDTWDTSSVDSRTRQTVLATSTPVPGRFLETIPASPTTSRSPSPGTPLDLQPPRSRRRSRSYSPAPSVHSERSQTLGLSPPPSACEAHIHPLFRSDSPTPPPITTSGTVVTAAPLGGRVIAADRKTLNRMRSGSLPVVPSPLSRQGSLDNFHQRRENGSVSPSVSPELPEEPEETDTIASSTERKMTPPIPDWVMSADSRLSLSGYNSRKLQSAVGAELKEQI